MSNDLLDKAQALLEAREKADQREIMVADYISRRKDKPSPIRMLKTLPDKDRIAEAVKVNNAEFFAIAANTSAEIITGYQDIVREARNALNSAKSVLAACKMVAPQGSTENHSYLAVHGAWHRTRDTIARLDAAIPPSQHHTTMNS